MVLAAGIKFKKDGYETIFVGKAHIRAMECAEQAGFKRLIIDGKPNYEEGFVCLEGTWLDRVEAAKEAKKCAQTSKEYDYLSSQDIQITDAMVELAREIVEKNNSKTVSEKLADLNKTSNINPKSDIKIVKMPTHR